MLQSINNNSFQYNSIYRIPFQAQLNNSSGIFNENMVSGNLKTDQFVLAKNKDEKKLSTTQKVGIGAVIITLAGIIAASILSKGKKTNISSEQATKLKELVSSGKIDEKYLEIFQSTEHLSGDKFIKEAYNKISKLMGYENNAPKLKILYSEVSGASNTSSIVVPTKLFNTKAKQFRVIRHELEHFRQNEMIYRAFGKDAYIEAKLAPSVERLRLNDDYCKSRFGKTFKELSAEELAQYKENAAKEIESKVEILEKVLQNKGKIEQCTPEYLEAQKYLDAAKNYKTPTMVLGKDATPEYIRELKKTNPEKFKFAQQIFQEYKNNALEVGAVEQETKIKNMYELFLSVINAK